MWKKFFFLFFASFFVLLCSFAIAQDTQQTVTAIEVKGNQSISTNTVLSKMKTRIGEPYLENVISDDLKRLYLLGYFSDIKIDTEEYKDGLKVIVTVTERPLVEKIELSGVKRLKMRKEKIAEKLKSKEKQYLDYPKLEDDSKILKEMYEKAGYSQAEVEYKVDINKETNRARIEFVVKEGKRVRIKNIWIKGNRVFSDGRILRLMKTKRAWLLNAGILREEVLKQDIERIRSFYQKEGFADIALDYEIRPVPGRAHLLYIEIEIEEGKRYRVGDITISGNKDITESKVLSSLKEAVRGKVYSEEAVKKDLAAIQGIYFDKGYISAQVRESTSLNPETDRVDIAYDIKENEVSYVNKINIRGNIKTKDLVVRRDLRIYPGDRFDGEKLRRSKERLQNLGFFEEVSYDIKDTEQENKKDLVVEVKEAKTGAFSFGGGYSTVDDFIGFVEIEQKNFDWRNFPYFTGAGQDLKLRASFGTLSSGFDLSFTEPWLFDYPLSFGFDLYKRSREREEDVGYGYDEDVTGGDIRLGKDISEYVRASLMYRYDTIEIDNISETATTALKNEAGENSISSLRLGLTFDSRDNVFTPRKGDLYSGSLEYAGGPFGADKDFWKFFGRASHYIPLFRNSVLELRARTGLADVYDDTQDVPIYERFFAGGAYTIRGYDERKVGPIDPVSKDPLGGESLLIGNLEYSYPLLDLLRIAVFFDSGNVWEKMSDIGAGGFKSSFGLGLRIKTPIGPILLDYGIPLNKEPGEDSKKSGRLHFSASHGF